MRVERYFLLLLASICLAFYADKQLSFDYPDNFPEPVYNFDSNPLSEAKIELGRALFFDPILSADNTISCASCHSPYNAFAHTDHDLSHGIADQIGKRNAPALFNLAWQNSFNWDGAVNHLDMQALAPINDPLEMGETTSGVVRKLQTSTLYPGLFYKAFGDSLVTGEHMLKALSQFELTLVSANSKYDSVQRQEATFTSQELQGYVLFQKNCNSCHQEPLFSTYSFSYNGLPVDTGLNDFGKWEVTGLTTDSLLFKVPSLRNLSFTFPYMHDGRFKKLSEVLKHYSTVGAQNELGGLGSISLNSNQRADLIAFLLTLNDKSFVFNPAHQFPRELVLSSSNEFNSDDSDGSVDIVKSETIK